MLVRCCSARLLHDAAPDRGRWVHTVPARRQSRVTCAAQLQVWVSRILSGSLLALWACVALGAQSFDAAAAFGALPSVMSMSLSPDGQRVAFIGPDRSHGTMVYTMPLAPGARVSGAVDLTSKDPFRFTHCDWLSSTRLACQAYGIKEDAAGGLLPLTRILAFDANGQHVKVLSTQANDYTRGYIQNGGEIIDWLPDEDGAVLMTRQYRPDEHTGSRLGSASDGLGVDRIDTRTLAVTAVEAPDPAAFEYLTDGHGAVRVMGLVGQGPQGLQTGELRFLYRVPGSRAWQALATYQESDGSGFMPLAVDRDQNIVYGLKKVQGRAALCSIKLDGSLKEQVVYARPDVDVSGLFRVGRDQRVVGVAYVTQAPHIHYFDPQMEQVMHAIMRALPGHIVELVDASADESKLLILARSDSDPGVYYIFDRPARRLNTFLVVRSQLEGVQLARVRPITYPAADGVSIPAYLTLPPGRESAKGLPAIVLPHGGPSSRDQWDFDWLAQFFAARGYAVLQPNYRGSSGYGDAWSEKNGFKSWSVAISDVLAAGHWLVSQGIADPGKLAIVGWSYGGYAALQSAVVEPGFFKAVVAIAPVTDLAALKEEHRHWTDFNTVSDFVGSGANMHEGSPAEHADRIRVPVLLFHGAFDVNVGIQESRLMAARLKALGRDCQLVTWSNLDHQLADSAARTEMLRRSDAFLRKAMGM